MAKPSDGDMPLWHDFADANQAVAWLDQLYHWNAKRLNTAGRRLVTITVTHRGARVSAVSSNFVSATAAVMAKLRRRLDTPLRIIHPD